MNGPVTFCLLQRIVDNFLVRYFVAFWSVVPPRFAPIGFFCNSLHYASKSEILLKTPLFPYKISYTFFQVNKTKQPRGFTFIIAIGTVFISQNIFEGAIEEEVFVRLYETYIRLNFPFELMFQRSTLCQNPLPHFIIFDSWYINIYIYLVHQKNI